MSDIPSLPPVESASPVQPRPSAWRRPSVIIAAVALALAAVLIGYGFRDGINLYRAPSQMAENPPESGEVFRLGGLVEAGTLVRGASETVTFSVTDGGVRDFAMMYVNDYGGHPELKYRCEGNTCKALPPSQQG